MKITSIMVGDIRPINSSTSDDDVKLLRQQPRLSDDASDTASSSVSYDTAREELGVSRSWDSVAVGDNAVGYTGMMSLQKVRSRDRLSIRKLVGGSHHGGNRPQSPHQAAAAADLRGFPGYLTEEEVRTYQQFRAIVDERGGDFRDAIFSFGEVEGEPHALCRWLRARKFNLEGTVLMVRLAVKERAEAKRDDFYPDPREALGVDPDIFNAQYPQLYTGRAKNGCPVFISKPGRLNVDAIECLTTRDGILKNHWHAMMHDFANRLRQAKAADENFTRFECFCVLDLDQLTASQISQRALNITNTQTRIDSLCFPETMNHMIIVNAPRFFSLTWKIIKGWLDPRTAEKIEIISSRLAWEKRLRELVDEDQLPSDYGGMGEATTVLLQQQDGDLGKKSRRVIELVHLRSHASLTVDLRDGEVLEGVEVYTRSTSGAKFEILDARGKVAFTKRGGVDVTHVSAASTTEDAENETPTRAHLMAQCDGKQALGPGKVKIRADSKPKRFRQVDNFLVVCNVTFCT